MNPKNLLPYSQWRQSRCLNGTLVLLFLFFLALGSAHATDGTWTASSGGMYSATSNWSLGNVAAGTGATATFNGSGSIVIDANQTIGTWTSSWNNSTSLNLSGSSGVSLNFATSSATPLFSTATYFSRYDNIANLNITSTQGLNFKTTSNALVLKSGVTWVGFSGTLSLIAHTNGDGGMIFLQAANVLPGADFSMTPGSGGNGYSKSKLVLNAGANQTIGALSSTVVGSNTAYISSYVSASELTGGSVTGTAGYSTLTIGTTNTSGTFAGKIGIGCTTGGVEDSTANQLHLIKIGSGTQTFTGALNYSGTTSITNGKLLVSGTHTSGSVYTVTNGGTLGGTGAIIPVDATGTTVMVQIQSGGILRPGTNGSGSLTLSGTAATSPILSFASGASATFDLSSGLSSGKAVIVGGSASNDVTFNNTVFNFNDLTAGNLGAGQYVLFQGDSNTTYSGLTVDGSGYVTGGVSIGTGLSAYPTSTLQLLNNNIVLNVVLPPPNAPTGLAVTGTNGGVSLAWNISSGASNYTVKRSTTSGSGYATLATVSGTTFTDRSFVAGTTYYYVVSASNAYGTSVNSSQVSGTPAAAAGTWTGGTGNYSDTTKWSGGVAAAGASSTMTVSTVGTITVDTNVTIGSIAASWNNGTSLVLAGASGVSLTFDSGSPSINTATYFSRNDYISNLNISGSSGLTFNGGSNDLVLQSGVTWNGFSGNFAIVNTGNDGGILYAQGNNVLPPVDIYMTPGNETNGYGNTKLILGGTTTQTIGALNCSNTASNTAYISSYDGATSVGSSGTPSGTNNTGLATLNFGATNNSGVYSGVIGEAYYNSGISVISSTNAANLALVKLGAGTQTFSGLLFHTGTTTVSAGTLVITGTHTPVVISGSDTGCYVVSGSAMLAGTGLIRPSSSSGTSAMISVSGTLAPGWGATGTLTLDGTNSVKPLLSLASGAVMAIDLATGLTNDKLQVVNAQAGDLIFNNNSIRFNDPTSGSLSSGTYVLIHSDASNAYSGLTTDGSGTITSGLSIGGGLSNYSSSTLKIVGNDVVLILGSSSVAGTPTGVGIAVSGTQVTISWGVAANATSYTIYRSTTPNGTYTSIGSTSSLSFIDPSALNGKTYYYKVTASNGAVESPASTAVVGTPLDPSKISIIGINLRAYNTYGMAVSDTAGILRVGYWNNLVGPCIQGETVTAGTGSVMNHLGNILPTVGVSFTAGKTTTNNYSNGGTLKFGNDAVTVNPASNDANLYSSAFDQYDTTPSSLSVTGIPYTSYDVIFYIYDNGSTQGGTITANGNSLSIRGGVGNPDATGTNYVQSADAATASSSTAQGNYIRFSGLSGDLSASLVAKNVGSSTQRIKLAGFQIISNDTYSAPSSAPAAPASLTASGGNLQNVLNWSSSASATSYKIYRGTSSGSYSITGTVSAPMLSYADTNVSNGTTYYYAVSAVNSVGEGVKSSEASALPAAPSFTAAQRIVYQYSMPMAPIFSGSSGATWPYDSQRRAYLWIPPGCTKIQGVILGLHNMLEKPMFEDPTIRQACTDANLAIVFISPGDSKTWTPNGIGNYTAGSLSTAIDLDPANYKSTDTYTVSGSTVNYTTDINNRSDIHNGPAIGTRFANQSEQAAAEVQVLLQNLATESGYAELAYAPILMTDHSAGSSFLWGRTVHTSAVLSGRVVAIIPYKGTWGSAPAGVPILHISSEYQEISSWGNTWELGDAPSARPMRATGTNYLVGEFVQPGTGHYEYIPEQSTPIANFIRAVASARIPSNWSTGSYPTLNSIDPSTGWLVDVRYLGSGTCQPVSYANWIAAGNDPLRAYWYPDQTTAQSACDTMNAGFSKKPQMLNAFTNSTTLANLANQSNGTGYVSFTPTVQSDGSFKVRGASMNQSPVVRLYNAGAVGMPTGSIRYLVNNSGAVKQIGVDTFRIWMDRGSVIKTGQPWEPFVFAYHPGDSNYRPAYRPIAINTAAAVNNINGSVQSVTFQAIPNQVATNLSSINLNATASSGKPVQFWMVSGPYRNDENDSQGAVLVPDTAIPSQTKFPMRVVVGAWQWGTPSTLQSAPAVFNTFWIFKDSLAKWKFDNFGSYDGSGTPVTPSGNSDDNANPAGDGISNLMKYATGMSPLTHSNTLPAVQGTAAATISGTSGNVLTLTFNRIADTTLTYIVEATDNLAGGQWTTIWSSSGNANTAGTVTASDTVLMADPAHPKRFLRLRIVH